MPYLTLWFLIVLRYCILYFNTPFAPFKLQLAYLCIQYSTAFSLCPTHLAFLHIQYFILCSPIYIILTCKAIFFFLSITVNMV